MKEELISFETAKLTKEKGFPNINVGINNMYTEKGVLYNSVGPTFDEASSFQAPTQSLLQKWLREKHNIDIYIRGYGFGYYPSLNNVPPANQTVHYVDRRWNLTNKEGFDNLVTYEEALEKGLIEALKLININ